MPGEILTGGLFMKPRFHLGQLKPQLLCLLDDMNQLHILFMEIFDRRLFVPERGAGHDEDPEVRPL